MRTEPYKAPEGEAVPESVDVETIVALYDGDPRTALAVAIDEIAHLQEQLIVAAIAMSRGYTRGWTP